ncbi:MAG: ferritin-like domain-containing protein [Pseudomonadota bacterium]
MRGNTSLCEALCHVLGNTCRILRTAKSYEWNASGRGAILAQQCFKEQAEELDAAIDPIAYHILGLGGSAILDYSDSVVAVNPPASHVIPALADMISNLVEGHVQANHSVGAAIDIAREIDEVPTVQILAIRVDAHRAFRQRLLLVSDQL